MKTRNKYFSRLTAFLLAAVMMIALGTAAFALTQGGPGAPGKPKVTITVEKALKVDNVINIGKLTSAKFTLTRQQYKDGPTGTAMTTATMPMPAADNVTVNMSTVAADNLSRTGNAAFGNIEYTIPGTYVYGLTEDASANVPGVTYDTVNREVRVYVENLTDASGNVLLNDDGTAMVKIGTVLVYKETTPGTWDKVGTYPGTVNSTTQTSDSAATVSFTNTFGKDPGPTPGHDEYFRIEVTKKVTGAAGDTAKEFNFNFVTDNNAAAQALAYQVFSSSGVAVITGANKSGPIATGGTFSLKSGEYVRIYGMADGANYTITEQNATDYKTSIIGKANGADINVGEDNKTAGSRTYTLTNPDQQTFTNKKDSTVPTGITMDFLPYVLMVALAGATGFVLLRKKSKV